MKAGTFVHRKAGDTECRIRLANRRWPGGDVLSLPANVRPDYEEAGRVLATSPRSACALLRVSAEKLCLDLCASLALGKPKSLDDAIGLLVANGLSDVVKQALDDVRVIGNDAVHAGQIDVHDTPEIAMRLMQCMNLVVEQLIEMPRQIAAINESLPAAKLQGIADRDRRACGDSAPEE